MKARIVKRITPHGWHLSAMGESIFTEDPTDVDYATDMLGERVTVTEQAFRSAPVLVLA